MQSCFSKFTRAPIQYINELRNLKVGSITMKGTSFYPAFPLSLLSSLLCLIALSTYMIYYFFAVDQSVCFSHILYGIIALAFLYPIESLVIYICLFGSVELSKSHCWKIFTIIFFGLMVTGLSFGGLGFAFLCSISVINPLLIPSTFLSSNTFIQIIVYSYLSFACLYLILLPLLTFTYNQTNKDPAQKQSCYNTFCCCIYYTGQFLFIITAVFIICIKILGPALLLYVMIQVVRAGFYNQIGNLAGFFSITILCICLPIFTFTVTYLIANFACKHKTNNHKQTQEVQMQTTKTANSEQVKQQNVAPNHPNAENKSRKSNQLNNEMFQTSHTVQNESVRQPNKRKSIFLPADQSKHFGQQEQSGNGIKNNML